jgi:MoxR-like ATPases
LRITGYSLLLDVLPADLLSLPMYQKQTWVTLCTIEGAMIVVICFWHIRLAGTCPQTQSALLHFLEEGIVTCGLDLMREVSLQPTILMVTLYPKGPACTQLLPDSLLDKSIDMHRAWDILSTESNA